MQGETNMGGFGGRFPTTSWSVVVAVPGDGDSRRKALSEMAVFYWKPLYFFARRKGLAVDASKDAVQAFFVTLLEKDTLERLDPERGRLRAFLRTAFSNFLANTWSQQNSVARGGREVFESADLVEAERDLISAAEGPEEALDREWALGILASALQELRAEFESGRRGGQGADFNLIQDFLGPSPPSYRETAERTGLSVPRLKSLLFRTRARYRELVRSRIQFTVTDEREADLEFEDLVGSLRA